MTYLYLIITIIYGGIVGSFLNVVVYRMPLGRSVFRPLRSYCPKCESTIGWYDNLPLLSWLMLRGRCRRCGAAISVRYPLVELACMVLFGGLYAVYYMTDLRPEFSLPGAGAGFDPRYGYPLTWPVLLAHLVLAAGLLAATIIDAEHYIIPLGIPWFATVVSLVLMPLAAMTPLAAAPAPRADSALAMAALCGAIGLIVGNILLRQGWIPRSFDDPVDESKTVAEDVLSYEHPRREALKELLFLVWPVAGLVIGWLLGRQMTGQPGDVYRVLGGVGIGYFTGAALVWGTRVLGTLAFGKEAMGLGDVHLWGAVGAVIGPVDAVVAFFIAPFFGLGVVAVMAGLAAMVKGKVRVIPYGPFLAAGAVVMMVLRTPILRFLGIL
ncbi:MAG: prepilin peptidase [Phycisphaeraceae bacterium]|nr:prepilin peptidase [Phycisphaeraceae bacterium]